MPKIETNDESNVKRDLFPLNPAMIRRLRAHDQNVADHSDMPPTAELKFKVSDE